MTITRKIVDEDMRTKELTSLENRTCCFNSPFRAITLTSAYSSRPANTKTRHADIQTSMALIYDTRGNCERIPAMKMRKKNVKYETTIRLLSTVNQRQMKGSEENNKQKRFFSQKENSCIGKRKEKKFLFFSTGVIR